MVALLLLVFVAVSLIVVWRRSFGIAQAGELRQLERQRSQLQAELTRLERDIRDASTRARLVPLAQSQLGMHVPLDNEIIYLERPTITGRDTSVADGAPPIRGDR